MFSIQKLIRELSEHSDLVQIGKDESFDFNRRENAFVIESGTLLAFADKRSVAGVRSTQTFSSNDPIGFAEVIAGKARGNFYEPLTDLSLHKFTGTFVKNKINSSNIFSQTIIKYSLGRIFGHKKAGGNILLEDKFIFENYQILSQFKVPEGQTIFKIGDTAEVMYFIEKGGIDIISANGRKVAELGSGDCFGEAALIKDRARNYSAVAVRPTRLVLIDRKIVKQELEKDHAIVRLSVILLLKRLELMNKLNLVQEEK